MYESQRFGKFRKQEYILSCYHPSNKKGIPMERIVDYAVIGGGIAGAYSAWRIKQAMPEKHVVLFEYSDRIGGRLFTVQLPGISGMNAELGGMRYIPEIHPIFTGLVDELGLPHRDFPMGDPKLDPQGLKNFAFFRQELLRVGEMSNSGKLPYRVGAMELNKTPDGLQEQVLTTLIPNYQHLTFDDWFRVEVFGQPLYKYGFWNLLYRVLSPEAFEFLRIGSGYDTNVSNGSSVTLLPTGGEYSSSNPYKTVVGGMESVPKTLVDSFQGKFGGEVALNFRLKCIETHSDELYNLMFQRTTTVSGKTLVVQPVDESAVLARNVILAVPRRSLERVAWQPLHSNPF